MSLQFRIEPLAVEIGGLTVEGRASILSQPKLVQNGFVDRVEQGRGRFLTPIDIERSGAINTAELLQRTGRVTTQYSFSGESILMLGPQGYCTPVVYLDGVRIAMDMALDQIAPVQVLEAAEVYRSASEAPVEYAGGMGGCGVIVLWTKTRR